VEGVQVKPPSLDGSVIRPHLKLTRPRALRLARKDLPWLTTVRLPWGLEVCLLNISRSGMLVETSSKFTPGSIAQFELRGGDDVLVVPARFVRSEVVTVDGRGVRYHAAAAFQKELDLEDPRVSRARISSTRKELADWLRTISIELDRNADPAVVRERLERGLCALVTARDVEILTAPITPDAGCESFYFTIIERSGHRAVLQVTFEPGRTPSELDLRMLQAGAALAAVVLQLGGTASNHSVPP
jgi:hypothetical protein